MKGSIFVVVCLLAVRSCQAVEREDKIGRNLLAAPATAPASAPEPSAAIAPTTSTPAPTKPSVVVGGDTPSSPEEEASPSPEQASPSPNPAATNATTSSAKNVPAVTVSQTLNDYTTTTFNQSEQTKFENTLESNIAKFAGPVTVGISNVKSGSVVFDTTVKFLNGQNASANAYKAALTSDVMSIYGSTYASAVTVNTSTIMQTLESNPSGAAGLSISLMGLVIAFAALLLVR